MKVAINIALLAALGADAAAQQPFIRRLDVSSPLSISVVGHHIHVRVVGWNRNEVEVRADLPPGQRVDARREEDRLVSVRVASAKNAARGGTLEVRVPRGNAIDVETSTGTIQVDSVSGLARLKSVAGDITVRGPVRTLSVETLTGGIAIDAPATGVVARTTSGAVHIAAVDGFLEVFTGEGSVDISRSRIAQATITTVSGRITASMELMPNALARLDSYVGAVDLRLPETVDASFEISSFGGTIQSDFDASVRRTARFAPGKELRFSRGTGSARVVIDTFSGNIHLAAR